MATPVLPAARVPDERGGYQLAVFCPWCETAHWHGQGDGNRAPHCLSGRGSPFVATGYDLAETGVRARAVDVLPAAPLAGQGRLRAAVDVSRASLQGTLVKALLRRRRIGTVMARRIGETHVSVMAPRWSIAARGSLQPSYGDDLLGLVRAVYGVSEGVAAVRVLEGATGARFDAEAASAIAAAVDAWVSRGAPKADGRS